MIKYGIWCFMGVAAGLLACTRTLSEFEQLLQQEGNTYHLLITNGQIVDGTGKKGYSGDILVRGDTIAFVGEVDSTQVRIDQMIDAQGMVVSPGFIDTHAHGSPLQTPSFANFLSMGVTTVVLGQDGSSPESMATWMQQVEDTVPGANVAMFVGHGTLRMLSGVAYHPRPSTDQLKKMGDLLKAQLQLGCFGMSTGLEYVPGTYAPAYELAYLAEVAGAAQTLVTSHIRNEDDSVVEQSIREILALGKYCPVHISHLKAVYGQGAGRADELLQLLAHAREQGIPVTADVYPYTASYTSISIVFPEWALPPHDYKRVVRTQRKELAAFLRRKIAQRNGPEATLLGTPPFAGKTLAQLAQERQKPFEEILIDDIGPGGASGAYFVMDDRLQSRLITDSLVMICSDGSPTGHHPRGHGTFAKIIEDFVVKNNLLTLEEAVRKMTSLAAQTLGIPRRGKLQPGYAADIIIFDPAQVRATATYENPFQLSEGFHYVIINGDMSIERGKLVQHRYGQLLRKH